ncbi:hypothetical protein CLOSYM_01441 [[Clostridium] symbiosum ATCC 14940]|uniref:Toxin-antitoxin system, toxin component, RelE domain protein n=1 Tax=[Clostridium] symbiosum ATCC 14940 TaxID=411472 RepID=A0ABC9U096_CLOSY|nr:hypothetical protein CLOSYM_01441 [[Clostridium] symbiosum ATCC 14940]
MGKPPLPFTRIRKNYIIIQNERYIVSIRYNNTFCAIYCQWGRMEKNWIQ